MVMASGTINSTRMNRKPGRMKASPSQPFGSGSPEIGCLIPVVGVSTTIFPRRFQDRTSAIGEGAGRQAAPQLRSGVGTVEDLGEVVLRLLDRAIDVVAEDRALDQVEERAGAADEQLIRGEGVGG